MTLNNYETIYILKSDITENINLELVNIYKKLIKENGGQRILVQHRGRRHLSYNIAYYYDGIYVQMNYQGNGGLVKLIEKSMKLNSHIVRFLTVRNTPLADVNI